MFWNKKKQKIYRDTLAGFSIGQVVRHKVTYNLAVIVDLIEPAQAVVSTGWFSTDEFETTLAEIEPAPERRSKESQSVDAVDRQAADPGKPTTRV